MTTKNIPKTKRFLIATIRLAEIFCERLEYVLPNKADPQWIDFI